MARLQHIEGIDILYLINTLFLAWCSDCHVLTEEESQILSESLLDSIISDFYIHLDVWNPRFATRQPKAVDEWKPSRVFGVLPKVRLLRSTSEAKHCLHRASNRGGLQQRYWDTQSCKELPQDDGRSNTVEGESGRESRHWAAFWVLICADCDPRNDVIKMHQ